MKQTTDNWKKLIDRFKDLGVSVKAKDGTNYKIKFLLGTDAVHGDQHVLGNILWPHNIGLSCTHNENHF
jgi:beta-glucosidase